MMMKFIDEIESVLEYLGEEGYDIHMLADFFFLSFLSLLIAMSILWQPLKSNHRENRFLYDID